MPKVSVVIPVYNAKLHLRQCLDSILCQTLEDIEILCVDDGSTDESLDILREYADRDSRLTVVRQQNAGAGAARNAGLQAARGEYLSFLDSDDFFEPTMLEDVYTKCIEDRADVGIYKTRYFHTVTGRFTPANGVLKTALLPKHIPFSYRDMPDHIFVFVSPAAWNKMFRRDFVLDHGLRFQEIRRTNDYLFTKLALVKADRITVIDKALVNYRIGMESNLQSANHETPLEFFEALQALKQELVESGIFAEVERGFVNAALSISLYTLNSLRTTESFRTLYERLRDESFADMGIVGREKDFFLVEHQYEQYLKIMALPPEVYLLDEVRYLRDLLGKTRDDRAKAAAALAKARKRLSRIQESRAYKIGQIVTSIPRKIKHLLSSPRKAE